MTAYAKNIQKKTMQKLIQERSDMVDDPFCYAWQLANEARTPIARYVQSLETFDMDREIETLKEKVRTSTRTKYQTYVGLMNPNLTKSPIYTDPGVKEHERIVTTKLRLSSHNLAIEKGRWQRKPREERLCPECHVIQDETHAMTECRINGDVRREHCVALRLDLPDLFTLNETVIAARACYMLMKDFT
eukprot:GHVO01042142.1.p1 GENE.GHVO01042142.1~~GHVO01042142.1.p1  ORF type:complete len:189 (+),score=12.61 GHVO01042142.1:69-635(+)